MIRAPARTGGPEGVVVLLVDFGSEAQQALRGIVTEAIERQLYRPRRHGAGVVVAELYLIPGIAVVAGIALAHGFDDSQSLIQPTFINKMRGHLVFDAGPHFIRVNKGQRRTVAARPGTKQEAGLVTHGINALYVVHF